MKTLYLSDLDGTLLNEDALLSPFTEKTLISLMEKGLAFSVATARTAATALRILSALPFRYPIVLMNGVLVYDTVKSRYVRKTPLGQDAARAIAGVMDSCGAKGLMYALEGDTLTTYYESLEQPALREFCQERAVKFGKVFIETNSFAATASPDTIYFTLIDSHERLLPVYEKLKAYPLLEQTLYKDIYSPDLWYLEVFHRDASKRNAALYLKESCGFDRLVGFGDNLNDLPLFSACDACFAVDNAKDEVKAAATAVIEGNRQDGVAKWLAKMADEKAL